MKIVDIFNTKYLAVHWQRDLRYFLELLTTDKRNKRWDARVEAVRAEGTPYTIDLADARICRDVMNYIVQYDNKLVRFIDSADPVRNGMLEENSRRCELDYKVVPLPTLDNVNKLPNYLTDLQRGVVYGKGDLSAGLIVRLAIIIQAYRPDIMLDLTGVYEDVYGYITSAIDMHSYEGDKVSYVIGSTIFTQDINSDGTVSIPGEGTVSWDSFVSRYNCIPAELGTKQLSNDPVWKPVLCDCIRDIPKFIDRKTSITDYFNKE